MGYTIILSYFKAYYDPAFRRDLTLYSQALNREVKMSEACCRTPAGCWWPSPPRRTCRGTARGTWKPTPSRVLPHLGSVRLERPARLTAA